MHSGVKADDDCFSFLILNLIIPPVNHQFLYFMLSLAVTWVLLALLLLA